MRRDELSTWARHEAEAIKRAADRHRYSVLDSLSDALSDGPWTERELTALREAVAADPEYGPDALPMIDAAARASEDEAASWWREQAGDCT